MPTLDKLLDTYFNENQAEKRQQLEQTIWQKYGQQGAIMITDMSGFSLVTQRYGIIYYLSMIEKMRQTTLKIINQFDGELVKFVADNTFARFANPENAVKAAVALNSTLNEENAKTPEKWDIKIASGIDYGDYLYTDQNDIYGDPVNCASKLGEDIASAGEILITESAVNMIASPEQFNLEKVEFSISGISLKAFHVRY